MRSPLSREIGEEEQSVGCSRHTLAMVLSSSKERLGASSSCSHLRLPAADSITPMRCQVSGTAWQNACSRPSGSIAGVVVEENTTPLVPMLMATTPGDTAPTPTAFVSWSPPPANTGVPAGMPVAAEAPAVSVPVISVPSYVRGSHSRGMPRSSTISVDQSRSARLNRIVPEPPALSVAYSPVSRYLT